MYKTLVQFFKKIFEPDKNGPTVQDVCDKYLLQKLMLRRFPTDPLFLKKRKKRKKEEKNT